MKKIRGHRTFDQSITTVPGGKGSLGFKTPCPCRKSRSSRYRFRFGCPCRFYSSSIDASVNFASCSDHFPLSFTDGCYTPCDHLGSRFMPVWGRAAEKRNKSERASTLISLNRYKMFKQKQWSKKKKEEILQNVIFACSHSRRRGNHRPAPGVKWRGLVPHCPPVLLNSSTTARMLFLKNDF